MPDFITTQTVDQLLGKVTEAKAKVDDLEWRRGWIGTGLPVQLRIVIDIARELARRLEEVQPQVRVVPTNQGPRRTRGGVGMRWDLWETVPAPPPAPQLAAIAEPPAAPEEPTPGRFALLEVDLPFEPVEASPPIAPSRPTRKRASSSRRARAK